MHHNALIMGIVNLTPDSFSDGGLYAEPEDALSRCLQFIEEGVDVLDLGAESTRPGSQGISEEEEWRRLEGLLPKLIEFKKNYRFKISVDTSKPTLMFRCAEMGVDMINNVTGLSDIKTLRSLGRFENLSYVCMHMHLNPQKMQLSPLKGKSAIAIVSAFFSEAHAQLKDAGFSDQRIFMDPGIGFGKDDAANFMLLEQTAEFAKRFQLCIGVSRKGFIGRLLNIDKAADRDGASKMLEIGQIFSGAKMIRTHEVGPLLKLRKLEVE